MSARRATAGALRAACAALAALCALPCGAGEVPDPLFWPSGADFLRQVDDGEFRTRLELHLLQYAADPGWRSEWAAQRYAGSGLFAEYGSTTGTELYVDSQVAVGAFPHERFQLRYDRREYQDGRFAVTDQRFDALAWVAPAVALALTGWPAFEKELSSMGFGLRVGAPRSPDALELRVVDERFVWNEKTDGPVRFTRDPLRILADGSWGLGPLRVHGTLDLGLRWAAGMGDAAPGTSARGAQRFADVEVVHGGQGFTAAARVTAASLDREQWDATGATLELHRTWRRAVLSAARELGRGSVRALAGWAWQRDRFSSPGAPGGAYDHDSFLWGVEAGLAASPAIELRGGYLGTYQRAERTVAPGAALASDEVGLYVDKVHARAIFTFQPRMAFELLLSHSISGGAFGGGSAKAIVAF